MFSAKPCKPRHREFLTSNPGTFGTITIIWKLPHFPPRALAMFQPHFEILPAEQRRLWPELAGVPASFVLYGGTALALRLGHRTSLDFDFFSSEGFTCESLSAQVPLLKNATILQNSPQTLVARVERGGPIKLSFFGGLTIGRVGNFDYTPDKVIKAASLLDLSGTKAAVVTQRAESKDYLDLLALENAGIHLPIAMAAARALYGERYNPMLTLKALSYFGDGDLHALSNADKQKLRQMAESPLTSLPPVHRISDQLG